MSSDFIDVAESVASKMNMDCCRTDNEFTVKLKNGKFVLSVLMRADYDVMHFSCDLKFYCFHFEIHFYLFFDFLYPLYYSIL